VWLQQKQNASQTPQSLAQNVLAPTNKSLTRNEGCDRQRSGRKPSHSVQRPKSKDREPLV